MKLIAETAWHHDGDIGFFEILLDNILLSSADIVKLHILLDIDRYIDKTHPAYSFLDERVFNKDQWKSILNKVASSSKELMLLLNDYESVDLAAEFQPSLVEVHSVALNNLNLLKHIDQVLDQDIPIVLGIGGSTLYEVENAISQFKNREIVLMFGFQNYPTKYEDVNFNKMQRIMNAYPEYKYGYADHTAWNLDENVLITLMGAALGMDYIEKHVTTHYGEDRTDYSAAISFESLEKIKKGMDILEKCRGDGRLSLNQGEISYSTPGHMKQIAIFNESFSKGKVFDPSMVDFLRSGLKNGISQTEVWNLIGKELTQDVNAGDPVNSSYFVEEE